MATVIAVNEAPIDATTVLALLNTISVSFVTRRVWLPRQSTTPYELVLTARESTLAVVAFLFGSDNAIVLFLSVLSGRIESTEVPPHLSGVVLVRVELRLFGNVHSVLF